VPDQSPDHGERLAGPIEVEDEAGIEAICELRGSVWRETGAVSPDAFPSGGWRDGFDAVSRHWAFTLDGRMVAAARLSVHDRLDEVPEATEYLGAGLRLEGRIAAPARVVVAASARRRGLAWRLLDVQEEAARDAGALHAVAQSSPGMVRLRERRGWRDIAPASPDPRFPGVRFRVMTLAL
jgi:GNAT superfamily N-acetyltransferase